MPAALLPPRRKPAGPVVPALNAGKGPPAAGPVPAVPRPQMSAPQGLGAAFGAALKQRQGVAGAPGVPGAAAPVVRPPAGPVVNPRAASLNQSLGIQTDASGNNMVNSRTQLGTTSLAGQSTAASGQLAPKPAGPVVAAKPPAPGAFAATGGIPVAPVVKPPVNPALAGIGLLDASGGAAQNVTLGGQPMAPSRPVPMPVMESNPAPMPPVVPASPRPAMSTPAAAPADVPETGTDDDDADWQAFAEKEINPVHFQTKWGRKGQKTGLLAHGGAYHGMNQGEVIAAARKKYDTLRPRPSNTLRNP